MTTRPLTTPPLLAADEGLPPSDVPGLRRDAARNRAKILAAAREAFNEEGVDVGVEVIAQRAGVGVGTIYRRFPTKELLIDAVVDELLDCVLSVAESALEHQSPADGFAEYLRAVGWLQFEHVGCLTRLWRHSPNDKRDQIKTICSELLANAQQAGAVRTDVVDEDVAMLFWSQRGVIEATAAVSPHAWLRHLDLLLSALAPGQRPLEHPPLTAEQTEQANAAAAIPLWRRFPTTPPVEAVETP
jgi:AcrR family transcriptional regulator